MRRGPDLSSGCGETYNATCGVTVGTVIAAHSPMAQPAWLTNSSGTYLLQSFGS